MYLRMYCMLPVSHNISEGYYKTKWVTHLVMSRQDSNSQLHIIFTFTVSKSVLKKLGVRPEWFENVEIPISIVEIFEGEEYPDVSLPGQ